MSHPEVTASSTQPVPKVIELPGAPPFREWHIECPIHGPQTVRTYMRNGLFGEPKCYICQREEGEKMARSEAIKGEALATTIALQNFFGPSIGGDDSSACFTFDRFKTSGFQHVEKAKTLCERFADRFVIRAEERGSHAKESPKNGTYQKRYVPKTESPKNGTEVHTKNGTKVGPKNGTIESPKFGTRTGIEQGITGIRQEGKAHASRSLPVAPPPPGLDDEAEAEWNDLTARAALEADSMPEDVFSPDAQIPIENIDARFATASDSIFGTDTPPKDQNAAERKSEAISKPKRKRVSSSVVKDKPEDISQEVWDDWLTTRRAKRLPLTQTALNSVRREAASAGLTFQAAVTFAVEQGWAAFRAEWYRNATRKGDSTKTNARYLTAQERYEERMRKAGEMSDEEYFAQFDLPEEILNYEKAQEAKRHVAS